MVDLTTYVVDDDEAARNSLTSLLRAQGIRARAFASAQSFLDQLPPDASGCVITDVRMPGMDGLTLLNALRARSGPLPVIVLTGFADVPLAVAALKAGASDFIEKPFDGDAIVRAVRGCLETSRSLGAEQARRYSIDQRLATLTDRETQVFDALVEGLSNKEIGLLLQISPRTVEIHRARIMAKMNAQSLSELVRLAIENRAA
jgi:two-component system response regulator FixJ